VVGAVAVVLADADGLCVVDFDDFELAVVLVPVAEDFLCAVVESWLLRLDLVLLGRLLSRVPDDGCSLCLERLE